MKKRGATLIELIIVIVLMTIAGSLISVIIVKGIDIWNFYKSLNKAQAEAELTMKKITNEMRKMQNLTGIAAMSGNEFRFVVYDPPADLIGFKIDQPDSSQLIFYDKAAAEPASPYSDVYKEENIIQIDGVNYLKFKLARVSAFALKYYGVNLQTGDVEEITDINEFKDLNSGVPGPGRLIKIFLTAEEGGRTFSLGTVVRLRAPQ